MNEEKSPLIQFKELSSIDIKILSLLYGNEHNTISQIFQEKYYLLNIFLDHLFKLREKGYIHLEDTTPTLTDQGVIEFLKHYHKFTIN